MKNIYDIFNDMKADTTEYTVVPLTELEKARMKRNFRRTVKASGHSARRRWMITAACLAIVVSFSQTAFAQSVIDGIIQKISLGTNTVLQMDPSVQQVFDKDGRLIPRDKLTQLGDSAVLYDAEGNRIGSIAELKNKEQSNDDGMIIEKDIKNAVAQVNFQPKLPKQLPAGYVFDHAVLYKDNNGKASGDYCDLVYLNGEKKLYISQRRISPETAYVGGTDGTLEKLKINGHTAALIDGNGSIEWEADGVSVAISNGNKELTRENLIAFAQSFS